MSNTINRKLIAVLRHVEPSEIEDVCDILVEGGLTMIEVTANSHDYLESLSKIKNRYPSSVMLGVGTVTTEQEVIHAQNIGGKFIVSPHTDPLLIAETKSRGMLSLPGVFSPTEALTALEAGADYLKFFPANWAPPNAAKDIKAVLPPGTIIYAVGGISPDNFASYWNGGFDGFGLGSSLYYPGISLVDLGKRCAEIVSTYDRVVKKSSS